MNPSVRLQLGKHPENIDRIRAEQARVLYRNCPVGVIGAAIVSLLLAAGLNGSGQGTRAIAWSLSIVGCAAAHLALCALYWRAKPVDAEWRKWIGLFTLIAFIEGIAWSFGAIMLTSPNDFAEAIVLLLAWAGVASAGIVVFGAYLPTYVVFLGPAMLPHIYIGFLYRYPFYQLLAALEITFVIALPLIAWRSSAQLVAGLRLQFANLDLAEDLRAQKELAERANLAKSQFLAAVSHDLRQPIHALELFIGALRNCKMDEEAHRLVNFIDSSVTAMGELFTSLLDISKLDAGVVQPRFEPVTVGPLLDRLCREYADEAATKGIALRCVRSSLSVHSDPVLLERVVRNIISNAVRYTETGGVLVGCRSRLSAVSIEVWDTGCGIAADQNELIFQEFYQVANPERDRSKGVGLGLAIVKRTAALIGAELSFRSDPGRGSVFRVMLARSSCHSVPTSNEDTPHAPSNALIFVIDDDLAIQQAMQSLLAGWGHRVVVAGSSQDLMAVDHSVPPDLIICDYRLRGTENGVSVIQHLQRHFGSPVPAILLTGDTAPGRIAEAQASGFVLLHKPLSNSRLRAAIGNLLRHRNI